MTPNSCFQSSRHQGDRRLFAWLAGMLLASGLAILLWLAPGSAVKGSFSLNRSVATGAPASGVGDLMHVDKPPTYTTCLPYIAKDSRLFEGPYGFQVYSWDLTHIDRMVETGPVWVRLPLGWATIEKHNTTPAHYKWSASFEQRLARMSAHHIKVILQVGYNPKWAATYSNGPIDLVDIGELTEFIQAVVARYSQPPYNVKYWEFYNEPDNGNVVFAEEGQGYFGHTPEAYVDVLRAVYQPIKAIDPEAKVLLGGLAYDAWPDPFVQDFLDQVLLNGGAAYFDLMNFHYYRAFGANWEPYGHDILGKLAFLRDKLASFGVDKPLVCTETGWYSSYQGGNGHEIQSRYVVQSFVRSMTTDMEFAIWYTFSDYAYDPRGWGLWDVDFNPKQSYNAYRTLIDQLYRARYVRTIGPEETGSDQIEAYEFAGPRDDTIMVTWTNDVVTRELELQSPQVTVVDKFGNEAIVYDGGDGAADGRVHVSIGPSPVYLRFACCRRQ